MWFYYCSNHRKFIHLILSRLMAFGTLKRIKKYIKYNNFFLDALSTKRYLKYQVYRENFFPSRNNFQTEDIPFKAILIDMHGYEKKSFRISCESQNFLFANKLDNSHFAENAIDRASSQVRVERENCFTSAGFETIRILRKMRPIARAQPN